MKNLLLKLMCSTNIKSEHKNKYIAFINRMVYNLLILNTRIGR